MVSTQDRGIVITADDVVVDFQGHALRYDGTPQPGTLGITASGTGRISIRNGRIGGYWFGTHFTDNEHLRIEGMIFDDIPDIAINVADSRNVSICDNRFRNFRYDAPKPPEESLKYLVGINIGAQGAIISHNHFHAEPPGGDFEPTGVETVFVLFSARVSQRCVVALNQLEVSRPLPRSYGVWVASDAQATIMHNQIHNLQYGICLGGQGSAVVGYNTIGITPEQTTETQTQKPMDTYGVSAANPKEAAILYNRITGFTLPITLPQEFVNVHNIIN